MRIRRFNGLRGFIFSLDSFIAFTLALIAIYSLLFFSAIPSGHYSTMLQAHALASDTLNALAASPCSRSECNAISESDSLSKLEYLVFRKKDPELVKSWVGNGVPAYFGYRFEVDGRIIYDSASDQLDKHKKEQHRLSSSSNLVLFETAEKWSEFKNPNSYLTCHGELNYLCSLPRAPESVPPVKSSVARLIIYI